MKDLKGRRHMGKVKEVILEVEEVSDGLRKVRWTGTLKTSRRSFRPTTCSPAYPSWT